MAATKIAVAITNAMIDAMARNTFFSFHAVVIVTRHSQVTAQQWRGQVERQNVSQPLLDCLLLLIGLDEMRLGVLGHLQPQSQEQFVDGLDLLAVLAVSRS